jgi:hypothetical protein
MEEDIMLRNLIPEIAKQNGITTPQEFSYKVNVTWPAAKRFLTGECLDKTPMYSLVKIARAFGVKVTDLFEDTEAATE